MYSLSSASVIIAARTNWAAPTKRRIPAIFLSLLEFMTWYCSMCPYKIFAYVKTGFAFAGNAFLKLKSING
jgi:hypothetical protein